MSACFMDCSLLIGFLLVVEQVAKLACDLTRPAPMSGGSLSRTAPREGYHPVGTSAVLRARKTGETLGDAGGVTDPRRASLTTLGAASPLLPPGRLRCGAKRRRRVRDVQGAEQSRGYSRGTERERSPEQPGPKGNAH